MFHTLFKMAKKTVLATAMVAVAAAAMAPASGYAMAPEPDYLQIKGYSPTTVRLVETQRLRQEWKQTYNRVDSPFQRIVKNIWYNNWVGSPDPFGSTVLRAEPQ